MGPFSFLDPGSGQLPVDPNPPSPHVKSSKRSATFRVTFGHMTRKAPTNPFPNPDRALFIAPPRSEACAKRKGGGSSQKFFDPVRPRGGYFPVCGAMHEY